MKETGEHKLPSGFSLNQAGEAIQSLLAHVEKSRQNVLFNDAPIRINMDISAFKIPESSNFTAINLPYSPYPADPDILFIIPDDKKNSTEPEQLVNRMKDKLAEFNITNIREVMTLKQVRDDFSTYEAKRALAKRIDIVIAMRSVFPLLPSILGREFYKKKKVALQIKLQNEDKWDEIFEKIIKKTILNVSLKGQTSTVMVGHSNLSKEELTQNVSKIVNWILRLFPGGWENVNNLALNAAGIPPLPIYYSEGTRKDVVKPVRARRAKKETLLDLEL